MKLKVMSFKLQAGKPIAFIHEKDAKALGIQIGDRVRIIDGKKSIIAVVDVVSGFLKKGQIALSSTIVSDLSVNSGEYVLVEHSPRSESSRIIQAKIACQPYTKPELKKIISDIANDSLTEAEIAYFISGVHHCGMSLDETKDLTEAVFETGRKISWGNKKIADKHSIGGIPGNRTTPIIISICASAGILMPKTSSRAITSAAGTADTIETLARVDLSFDELKRVVNKTGACLAWGGSLGLAPADDKLIRVEKILNLDPEPQLLASILAKKLAAGSKYVLIDIPYGDGAKVSKSKALHLKNKFIKLGNKLGLRITVALTDGKQPIGNGIGPALEMKDVLAVLQRKDSPLDLERKSVMLAGKLLEMLGKARKGNGNKMAQEILDSGKAFDKFREIIEAQHGKIKELEEAKFRQDIKSLHSGKVKSIDNKTINYIARLAGCPSDHLAGIYLYKHVNDKVMKGEVIATIYSESKGKLRQAADFFNEFKPYLIK